MKQKIIYRELLTFWLTGLSQNALIIDTDLIRSFSQISSLFMEIVNCKLKVPGQKNYFFCRVSPISKRLFCYITYTFKRPSLRLFRFKISQSVPFLHIFDRFCGFLIKKGTKCEILNLNNRRLVRLKVHITTNSCTDTRTYSLIN